MRRLHILILLVTFCIVLPAYAYADTIYPVRNISSNGVYTIQKGDSLYKISKKFGVSINELKTKNNITTSHIKPGTEIFIPTKDKRQVVKAESNKKKKSIDNAPRNVTEATLDVPYHTVKKGDTLSALSKKYSIPVSEIKEINNLRSTKLKPGQRLLVKRIGPKTYTVKKGDTILKIARKFNIDADELRDINDLETDTLKPGQKLLLEPEAEPDEAYYGAILSEAQIEEEIKEVSESEGLGVKDKLILLAKKLLNIPYRFGGNSLLGIDCSAYVKRVYGMIGIDLPRSAREQFREGESVDKEELSIGDLVFFRTYASFPSHVGIYLGNDLFIHASSKDRRVTIGSLNTPYYLKRFIGAKRVIEELPITNNQ
jgi:LysM repeat protein